MSPSLPVFFLLLKLLVILLLLLSKWLALEDLRTYLLVGYQVDCVLFVVCDLCVVVVLAVMLFFFVCSVCGNCAGVCMLS